jgi:hypothetical protein
MPVKSLCSFEVLAQPVAPGVADIPYAQQGFFTQITNLGSAAASVQLLYNSTPAFVVQNGAVKLLVNQIDGTGTITQISPAFFIEPPVGFTVNIPAAATWLIGVQYLLLPPPAPTTTPAGGSTPQDSQAARGLFEISAATGTNLLVQATIRQVFYNYGPSGALLNYAEGAYALPLIGGPQQQF